MENKEDEVNHNSTPIPSMTRVESPLPPPWPGTDDPLHQSLQGLKELRSQLHHAADYCEAAFLKASNKKLVMENTKSYLCQSIVTVIDHLGTTSYNLDHQLNVTVEVGEIEQRINHLKQSLLTWDQYTVSLQLSNMRLRAKFPRHHRHYLSPFLPDVEKSIDVQRDNAVEAAESPSKKDQLPVTMGHSAFDLAVKETDVDATVLPIYERPLVLPKPLNFSFDFKKTDTQRRGNQKKKLMQGSNIMSFLRKRKNS